MPIMSGEVCTKEIRRLEREGKLTRHVPIIAVSANAREEQIKTAMEAGTVRPSFLQYTYWRPP